MKFNILLAVACTAIGASVAWILKPPTPAEVTVTGSSKKDHSVKGTPSSGGDSSRQISSRNVEGKRSVPTPANPNGPEEGSDLPDMGRFTKMIQARKQAKLDARISKLVSQLNLTAAQEAALREAVKDSMGSLQGIFEGDFDPSKIGALTNSNVIDDTLADILTAEQQEELDALSKRETANKVEAHALKELAKLSDLDMTQDQKDAAYDILFKQAETTVGEEAPANGMISMVTDSLGIELDSETLGIATTIIPSGQDIASGNIEQDPKALIARAQEQKKQRIDAKVEALRPVLDDNQLEQYRNSLELKSGGIFNSLFLEVGGEQESGE